jgi:hypothetical protein
MFHAPGILFTMTLRNLIHPFPLLFSLTLLIPMLHEITWGSEPISTNASHHQGAPSWIKATRIERVTQKIQSQLEWDIRRVQVQWYTSAEEFRRAHGFDESVLAFFRPKDQTIHIGPRVDTKNFDGVFGHELVHAVVYQKFKTAIPKWLEEGLANTIAKNAKADYTWLATQRIKSFKELTHPFLAVSSQPGEGALQARYHYAASTALMEMLSKKCQILDLLQMSVGKSVETYLDKLCGISNLDEEFKKWIKKQTGGASSSSRASAIPGN